MIKKLIFFSSIFIIFLCLFFFSIRKPIEDTVYIAPGFFKKLFNENMDGFHNLAHEIEKSNLKVKETTSLKNLKNAKYIVVFDFHEHMLKRIKRYPKRKLILFAWEPKCIIEKNHDKNYHNIFSKVYTLNDDLVDNKKYFKFYMPELKNMAENKTAFNQKKLLCMIFSNKTSNYPFELYSKRREAIKFFQEFALHDFDLYGYGWEKENLISYKGLVNDKVQTLKNYKFSICFENSNDINGYITEKIFHAFAAGCIPIYLGPKNTLNYIPQNCFIDYNRFKSFSQLYVYLKTMNEEEFLSYIENIKTYLSSKEAQLFSSDNFIKTFKKSLDIPDENN